MDNAQSVVEWYRDRIHLKQRQATALTIEVGLKAQEKEDPGSLIETLECLNTAIEILEQAKVTGVVTSDAVDVERQPRPASRYSGLMDDLGHSMAPIDFTQSRCRFAVPERDDGSRLPEYLAPSIPDRPATWEDSVRFFLNGLPISR